jgi:hypothetical protein
MGRHRRQRRKQRQRLEIGDILSRARQRLHVGFADAEIVGEEHHVELGALGGLRDLGVVLEIDAGVGLRLRVPPGSDVVPGRIEKRAEPRI